MTTNTEATVDAIRRAWGIRISQAEADSAACVIESRRLLRPDKPESYWSRALRNLMLDYEDITVEVLGEADPSEPVTFPPEEQAQ